MVSRLSRSVCHMVCKPGFAKLTVDYSEDQRSQRIALSAINNAFESVPPDPPRRGHTPFVTGPPSSQLAPTPLGLHGQCTIKELRKKVTLAIFSIHIPYTSQLSAGKKNMHKVGHICGGHRSIICIIATYSMAVHACKFSKIDAAEEKEMANIWRA